MIANKRIWITAVTLAIAAITIPIGLVAQEPDPTAEEGEGTDVQDDEQLANANDQLHFPANLWPKGPYIIMTPNNGKTFGWARLSPTHPPMAKCCLETSSTAPMARTSPRIAMPVIISPMPSPNLRPRKPEASWFSIFAAMEV